MKAADIWGACECRKTGLLPRAPEFIVKHWAYICTKTGSYCDPNYCLGPDEDELTEEKGGTDED